MIFKKANYVELWKREARTIKTAKKRVEKYLKPEGGVRGKVTA